MTKPYEPGSLLRSRADHSIYAVVLSNGQGIKLSMSKTPYENESEVGKVFNVTSRFWEEIEDTDYKSLAEAARLFSDWIAKGAKLFE